MSLALSLIVIVALAHTGRAEAQDAPPTTTATTAVPGADGAPTSLVATTTAPVTTSPSTAPSSTTGPTSTTSASTTTTTSAPAEGTDPAGPETATTLPPGPPPGFTEEQYRAFVDVVSECGAEPGTVCTHLLSWTGNAALATAAQWIVDVPLAVVVIALLALLANWLVRRAIDRWVHHVRRRHHVREGPAGELRSGLRLTTASATLGSAATVAVWAVAALLALAQFDVSIGPLLAGAGVVGVALGFGAQNIVRDVLAGIFVLVEDQYGVGDVIDAGRAAGTVEAITLRVTKLRDVDGTLWVIPNGAITEVANRTQRWARVVLDVDVAYGQDHHEVGRLMEDAAEELWTEPPDGLRILEPPELWGIERLGATTFTMRVAVKSAPADRWAVARDLRSRIKERFDVAGVRAPALVPVALDDSGGA